MTLTARRQSGGWRITSRAGDYGLTGSAVHALRCLADTPLPPGPVTKAWRHVSRSAAERLTRVDLAAHEPDSPRWAITSAGRAVLDAINEAKQVVLEVSDLERLRSWSAETFGPGERTDGVLDHIAKELEEVRQAPDDVTEWADVLILALDGAMRAGHEPAEIITAIQAKQAINEARDWPDWRTQPEGKAIEHVRSAS